MAVLLGAATAVAQSGASGSSSTTTGSGTGSGTGSSRNQSTSGAGTSGAYDSSSTTGSTTTGRTTGSSGTSGSTYGTGSAGSTSTGATGTTDSSTYGSGRSSRTAGAATSSGSDRLSWGDRRFVSKAADEGQDEVQLAQLAAQRATSSEVKSFAQKLVDDHSKVNSELTSLASQKNVKIDTDDDKDRAYKRLNKKSGSEFDQEFVEHMIDEHEKDIKMFEKAAKDAKDPEVRAFASKHVGHLREHLQTAQGLRQTLMPTGRSDDSSGRSTSGGSTGSGLGTSSTDSSSTRGTSTTSGSSSDTSTRSSTSGSTDTSGKRSR
jgi:putative membrane protein